MARGFNVSKNEEEVEEAVEEKIARENNHVYFYSEVDRASAFTLITHLKEAERFCVMSQLNLDIDSVPIYLHINSDGGLITAALAVIDVILKMRVPVYSVIEGAVASAGTLISVVCSKRYMRPNAYMLIHQLSSVCWGKMSEIEDEFKHLTELTEHIKRIYRDHTKMPKKDLNGLLKHDLWLNVDTALKHGLVDEFYS
jgi:ATP-dependent protease ClpP protease subunit